MKERILCEKNAIRRRFGHRAANARSQTEVERGAGRFRSSLVAGDNQLAGEIGVVTRQAYWHATLNGSIGIRPQIALTGNRNSNAVCHDCSGRRLPCLQVQFSILRDEYGSPCDTRISFSLKRTVIVIHVNPSEERRVADIDARRCQPEIVDLGYRQRIALELRGFRGRPGELDIVRQQIIMPCLGHGVVRPVCRRAVQPTTFRIILQLTQRPYHRLRDENKRLVAFAGLDLERCLGKSVCLLRRIAEVCDRGRGAGRQFGDVNALRLEVWRE